MNPWGRGVDAEQVSSDADTDEQDSQVPWQQYDALLRSDLCSTVVSKPAGKAVQDEDILAENREIRRVAYELRDRLWFCTKLIADLREQCHQLEQAAEAKCRKATDDLAGLRSQHEARFSPEPHAGSCSTTPVQDTVITAMHTVHWEQYQSRDRWPSPASCC